jgi:flagellar basal body-associated protein FliL
MARRKSIIIIAVFFALAIAIVGILFYQSYFSNKESNSEIENKSEEVKLEKPVNVKKPKPTAPPVVEEKSVEEENPVENPEPVDSAQTQPEEVVKEEVLPEKPKEPTALFVSRTKSLFNSPDLSPDNLPQGKVYYQGDNGKLESQVKKENNEDIEELTSYDYTGKKMDVLEIGHIGHSNHYKKYAVIAKNKISVFEIILTKNNKMEEKVTEYTITPQMKFVKGKTYTKLM